jgi:ribonuclease VapC
VSALILDSSVVLAAILGERGGDDVYDRLDEAVMSTVNVAEVYTYAAINMLSTLAIDAFFEETGIEIVPFSHEEALVAGRIAAITKTSGLSLGDRSCLALAIVRNAEVLTADHSWEKIAGAVGLTITMLR